MRAVTNTRTVFLVSCADLCHTGWMHQTCAPLRTCQGPWTELCGSSLNQCGTHSHGAAGNRQTGGCYRVTLLGTAVTVRCMRVVSYLPAKLHHLQTALMSKRSASSACPVQRHCSWCRARIQTNCSLLWLLTLQDCCEGPCNSSRFSQPAAAL